MALKPEQAFRERVKALRNDRGWSQAELAHRVSELGEPMDQRIVSNIEAGSRAITLDEAFVFAAALNVPPPLLWLPLGFEDRVEVTSKSKIHPHLALKWFRGNAALASTSLHAINHGEWREAQVPLRLYDKLEDLQHRAQEAGVRVKEAEFEGDDEAAIKARRQLGSAVRQLYRHHRLMEAASVRPPKMPTDWQGIVKRLGIDREET